MVTRQEISDMAKKKTLNREEMFKLIEWLEREQTQEELREYRNPNGKLNYFGTQKVLNDFCNKWKINEFDSYAYVLKLESGMFYIGETVRFFNRMRQHFSYNYKNHTDICRRFPAERIHEVILLEDADKSARLRYEDALTVEYANKYGKENVRGGHFSNVSVDISYSNRRLESNGFDLANNKIVPTRWYTNKAIRELEKLERIHPFIDGEKI